MGDEPRSDRAHESSILENSSLGKQAEVGEFTVIQDTVIGKDTKIWRFANIYGAEIGAECMIGPFVEVQADASIGDRSRIQSHCFVCSLVTIESDVFVSHGTKFVNDRYPPSGDTEEWERTNIRSGASIGTNATILPVEIGENALVGAGSVVVEDVPRNAVVAGNPAEIIRYREEENN